MAAEHLLFLLCSESLPQHSVWNAAANYVQRQTQAKRKVVLWTSTVLLPRSEGESPNFLVLVVQPGPVVHP